MERPEGVSVDILCSPEQGYGVQFMDASALDLAYEPGHIWQYETGDEKGDHAIYPDGAWLGYERGSGDNLVWVVAPSRADRRGDPRVVRAQHERRRQRVRAARRRRRPRPRRGQLRLCRYGIDDWLEQSEILTGQDAADALAGPRDGAREGRPDVHHGPHRTRGPGELGRSQGRVTLDACQGFSWDGDEHDLTADVLYWVLSPGWSGGVEGDVPMPDTFRQ